MNGTSPDMHSSNSRLVSGVSSAAPATYGSGAAQAVAVSGTTRTVLDMPPRAFTTDETSGLDAPNTATETQYTEDAESREAAALALVGLTTAAMPPTGRTTVSTTPRPAAASASTGRAYGRSVPISSTPRPALASAPGQGTIVSPGSIATPRPKLTYVKGVGLVSGEISEELTAAIERGHSPSKNPQKQKKIPAVAKTNPLATYSREKLVTEDGKNMGDWNNDETAELQKGVQKLGTNWSEIARRYVKTRTKQQCKSKNQKMVKSDGEDWFKKKVLTPKSRRWPASRTTRPQVKTPDKVPVESLEKRTVDEKLANGTADLKVEVEPPAQVTPSQQKATVQVTPSQQKATKPSEDDNTVNSEAALQSRLPEPQPQQDEEDKSGRRLSKRRSKRSVAQIREEFEAKQEMKQSLTKKAKVDVTVTVTNPVPIAPTKAVVTRTNGQSTSKAKKVAAERAAMEPSAKPGPKASKVTTSSLSMKKKTAKAKKGPKTYARCSTPGCTRQRQGGCAGQCRKHYNQDRVAAGLALAPTYSQKCKVEGCNKLKQYGFGEYCRAHYAEKQTKAGAVCPVPRCSRISATGCDGMCAYHFKNQNDPQKRRNR